MISMKRIAFCLLVISLSEVSLAGIVLNPLSNEFIDFVNSQQTTWTAGRNFHEKTPLSQLRRLLGSLDLPAEQKPIRNIFRHSTNVDIPEYFDARENWPNCEIIKNIRDQSACGSDWAVSVASVITDRLCIASNGSRQDYVSDQELLECCQDCGDCGGGYAMNAWGYWLDNGLPTGGPYNSTTGCKAYSFPPCEHFVTGNRPQCSDLSFDKPVCKEECSNPDLDYGGDFVFPSQWISLDDNDEVQMQLEILKNGPLQSAIYLYSDFYSYKSGIYRRTAGNYEGKHSVRILGWGVENGTPYWLAANSWNEDWGDKGLFKILRGQNECSIESDIDVGVPAP